MEKTNHGITVGEKKLLFPDTAANEEQKMQIKKHGDEEKGAFGSLHQADKFN